MVICGYTCSLAEQQPKSIGARNPKVGGSIPHGVLRIFSLSRACDKMKKNHLFLFLYRAQKLTISLISIYKHYAIDIADPSSTQDASHMNFVTDLAHRGVSVTSWYSIGARNPKVWRSIPHGVLRIFSLSHVCDKTKINIFLNLPNVIALPEHPVYKCLHHRFVNIFSHLFRFEALMCPLTKVKYSLLNVQKRLAESGGRIFSLPASLDLPQQD